MHLKQIPGFLLFLLFILIINMHNYGQTIRFASSNTHKDRKAQIRYLCDAFELYYPGIRIKLIDYSDENPFELIDEQGKIKADIILADSPILHKFANKGYLKQSDSLKILSYLDEDDFYHGSLDAVQLGKSYIGIPYTAWLQLIWYRKDILRKLDRKIPKNTEDIYQTLKISKSKEYADYGIVLGTAKDRYLVQCFYQLTHLLQRKPKNLPKPQKEDLDFYKNLIVHSPGKDIGWRGRDFYFQRKSVFLMYSSHLMDDLAIDSIAADSLTGNHFPQLGDIASMGDLFESTGFISSLQYGNSSMSFGSVSGWGILKTTLNQKIIKDFISFFFRPDVYIAYMHMSPGGMLPVRPQILDDPLFYQDPMGVFIRYGKEKIKQLCQGLDNLTVLPEEKNYNYDQLYDDIWNTPH